MLRFLVLGCLLIVGCATEPPRTRAEAYASEECQRAQDRFNAIRGAAEICAELEDCQLTQAGLVELGEAYYEADYICGDGVLATEPAPPPE